MNFRSVNFPPAARTAESFCMSAAISTSVDEAACAICACEAANAMAMAMAIAPGIDTRKAVIRSAFSPEIIKVEPVVGRQSCKMLETVRVALRPQPNIFIAMIAPYGDLIGE